MTLDAPTLCSVPHARFLSEFGVTGTGMYVSSQPTDPRLPCCARPQSAGLVAEVPSAAAAATTKEHRLVERKRPYSMPTSNPTQSHSIRSESTPPPFGFRPSPSVFHLSPHSIPSRVSSLAISSRQIPFDLIPSHPVRSHVIPCRPRPVPPHPSRFDPIPSHFVAVPSYSVPSRTTAQIAR